MFVVCVALTSHGVDHISREAEGHDLGRLEHRAHVERHSQIDVDNLGGVRVEEDVVDVTVAQTDDEADDAADGHAACVGRAARQPFGRGRKSLEEEAMENRRKISTDGVEAPRVLLRVARVVRLAQVAQTATVVALLRRPRVAHVCAGAIGHQTLGQARRIGHPLRNKRHNDKRKKGQDVSC